MSSEKFCLQWTDFQDNIQSSFKDLRENIYLSDVTLACKDGQNIETHKVIICASSPILREIIMMNKHPHPLIYLKGVNTKNMNYIIDFMYYGEVNIFQEELEEVLELAEEFKLKGLHKTSSREQDVYNHFIDKDYKTNTVGLNKINKKNDNNYENIEQAQKNNHKRTTTFSNE